MTDESEVVYKSAQESARHSDILMWQLTSITWGADILLLGFVLQAIEGTKPPHRFIAIWVSVIGMALTLFVAHFFRIAKIGQHIAYDICRDIENEFRHEIRLHSRINEVYERGVWPKAKHCVWFITLLFLVFWVGVLAFLAGGACLGTPAFR